MTDLPLAFRNVTRYATDVDRAVKLYEALGFRVVRQMEGFAILETGGVKLVLHEAEGEIGDKAGLGTAIGFTVTDPEAARRLVEDAGWTLTRVPDEEDVGLFWIYSDPDGNRINLVGERRHG